MAKWNNISSIDFDRTVRRVCSERERVRFIAGKIAFYCFKCKNIMPLEECECGNKEYHVETYTGHIGLYCDKCRKGFTGFTCICGAFQRIDSISLREKSPPGLVERAIGKVIWLIILPFRVLSQILRILILKPTVYLLDKYRAILAEERKKTEISIKNSQKKKDHEAEARKWTEIYYQRDPGWIGSGFPLRALWELRCAAGKGNVKALRSLEKIFNDEFDQGKRAEAAEQLKELTGKDYMDPDELKIKLSASRMRPGPLPPQPDDLP